MLLNRASRIITAVFLLMCTPSWAKSNLIERIEQAQESIVTVQTELTRTLQSNPPRQATYYRTAAGIVIGSSGIIVTNTHTIVNAPFIFVITKEGSKLPAQLLFASKEYDFSFLKINSPSPLPSISWADSSLVQVGESVITVGNSDFNNQSIMSGRIKSILQSQSSLSYEFLELNLDLYKGDSGGPVLDQQGRLLGMIMAKRESQPNSSIAITSNKIRQQYLQYKKNVT